MDDAQCVLGRVAKLLVTLHLQRGKVEQVGGILFAGFLRHVGDDEGQRANAFEQCLAFGAIGDGGDARVIGLELLHCLCGIECIASFLGFLFQFLYLQRQLFVAFAYHCREGDIAICGFQLPILLGHKVFYLLLAVYDERQRRCLHTTDGEYLLVLAILHGV